MCGISGVELLVIIVVAIIVLGPEKLPELMRMGGRLARDLRRLRGELGDVTREMRSQVKLDDLPKNLGVDRVRERMREAESEIDAIRARMNRQVDIKSLADIPTTDGSTGTSSPAASDSTSQAAAWMPESLRTPTTETERVVVKPARGSVAHAEDAPPPADAADAGPAATPPPVHRIRSNAYGAPELVPAPEPSDDEPSK